MYRRLEARRLSIVELDKKIKIEKLLAVHPVNSPDEIDKLISEANRIVFSTAHQHVALMVGKVTKVFEETTNGWDIFFVEKEKEEELLRPQTIKVYKRIETRVKAR